MSLISKHCKQTVSLARVSGTNGNGEATYGTASMVRCRFEFKRKMLLNSQGQQVVSAGRLILQPETGIDVNDLVTYGGRSYHVIQIDEEQGRQALSHRVAWLGG